MIIRNKQTSNKIIRYSILWTKNNNNSLSSKKSKNNSEWKTSSSQILLSLKNKIKRIKDIRVPWINLGLTRIAWLSIWQSAKRIKYWKWYW